MNKGVVALPPDRSLGLGDVYKIGKLGKPHGIKGEISMQVDDDVFDRVDAEFLILQLDGIMVPFFMEEYRFKSDETALVKFEDIDSQERARELTGTEVFFPRIMAEADDCDELSYAQLVGFQVVNATDGKNVGEIAYVDEQTINIMFELTDGTLIPASEELIVEVDTDSKEVSLNIPDGILDL